MQITVAGKPVEVREGITIAELLEDQQVKERQYVTVSVDEELYEAGQYAETVVAAGAVVELLYFMGGGAQ